MVKKTAKKNSYIKEGDLVRWFATDPHDIVMDTGLGIVVEIHTNMHASPASKMYRIHEQKSNKLLWYAENEVEPYKS
jgi:hypothetical protein